MNRAVRIHGGNGLVRGGEGHRACGALVQRVGKLCAVLRTDFQRRISEGDGFRRRFYSDYAGLRLAVVGPDADADLAGLQRGDQASFVNGELRLVGGGEAVAAGGAGGQGRGELRGLAHAEHGAGGLEAHAGGSLLDGDLEGGLLAVVGLDGDGGRTGTLAGDHAVCIHGHIAGVGRGERQRAVYARRFELRGERKLLVQADGGARGGQRHAGGRVLVCIGDLGGLAGSLGGAAVGQNHRQLRAVRKRVACNLRQARGKGQAFQRGAAGESAGFDARQRGGQLKLLQRGAASEHGCAEHGHALGQNRLLQRDAVLEDVLVAALDHAAQLAQLLGEDDLLQLLAALEGEFADELQLLGQVDGLQRLAILEGAGADAAQLVAEGDAREGGTALEGALSDFNHAIGQAQGGQRRAALERALADGGHAVGHGHVAASTLVAYEHAGFYDKFFFQIKHRLERCQRRVDLLRSHRAERVHADVQRFGKRLQRYAQLLRADLGGGGRRRRFRRGFLRGRGGGFIAGFGTGFRGGFSGGFRRRLRFGGRAICNSLGRCCDFRYLCAPGGFLGCNCGHAGHQHRRTGCRRKDAQPDMFHFHTSNEHNPPNYQPNYNIYP